MINGFDDITHDLTPYELETLLPVVVSGLSTKKGKDMAITNKVMCERLRERGFKASEARIRKLINHIRNSGLLPGLVASSLGYYITTDLQEILKYADSLGQRKREIGRVETSVRDYARELMKKAG